MAMRPIRIHEEICNLAELLSMKNPEEYTVVETGLSRFVDYYFSQLEEEA